VRWTSDLIASVAKRRYAGTMGDEDDDEDDDEDERRRNSSVLGQTRLRKKA